MYSSSLSSSTSSLVKAWWESGFSSAPTNSNHTSDNLIGIEPLNNPLSSSCVSSIFTDFLTESEPASSFSTSVFPGHLPLIISPSTKSSTISRAHSYATSFFQTNQISSSSSTTFTSSSILATHPSFETFFEEDNQMQTSQITNSCSISSVPLSPIQPLAFSISASETTINSAVCFSVSSSTSSASPTSQRPFQVKQEYDHFPQFSEWTTTLLPPCTTSSNDMAGNRFQSIPKTGDTEIAPIARAVGHAQTQFSNKEITLNDIQKGLSDLKINNKNIDFMEQYRTVIKQFNSENMPEALSPVPDTSDEED